MENIEKIIEKLPEGYEKAAYETGAFKQAREIKTARDLMSLILVYVVQGLSYIEVSVIAKMKGIAKISDVGFMGRFSNSGKLMKWLLEKLEPAATGAYKKPKALEEYEINSLDASVVTSGGKVRKTHRLHYAINIFKMKSEHDLSTVFWTIFSFHINTGNHPKDVR